MERTFIPELAVGYFQIADLAAAVNVGTAWAAALPAIAVGSGQFILLLDAEGGNVRWRNDGTDPTSAIGGRIIQDTQMVYTANNISTLSLIAETVGAKMNVSIFKHRV